jgi:uncharacterized alkaline shock family protein YloU
VADAAVPAAAPAAERGRLEVRTKALAHIAEQAALEVPRTVSRRTTLGLLGTTTPKATVSVHGDTARVEVSVACTWPAPLARVADEVRTRVAEQVAHLAGLTVTSVDVTVGAVAPEPDTDDRGRVQ